jgi:hypothetical protein
VDDVVPPVHVEQEQLVALQAVAHVEARVRDEAEDPGEDQRRAEDHAVPLRGSRALSLDVAIGHAVGLPRRHGCKRVVTQAEICYNLT